VQVRSMYMSGNKIKKLGYEPSYTLEQTIREIVEAYRIEH